MEYGIRADNDEVVYCHWCKELVTAGERAVEVGIIGFYGHAYCFRLRRQGMSKDEIKQRYLRYRAKTKTKTKTTYTQ